MRPLLLAPLLLLLGCSPSQSVSSEGGIDNQSLGFASTVIDGEVITSTTPDGAPFYSNMDREGVEVYSPLPAGMATLGRAGLLISSPKDTNFERAELTFDEEGGVSGIVIEGFNTDISTAIRADNEAVIALADYAKQLSADEREKFLGAMETIPELASLVKAALVP